MADFRSRSTRKKYDERRKERVTANRRGRVQEILASLGLWDQIGTLGLLDERKPTTLRQRLLQCHNPRLEVALADDLPRSKETAALVRENEKTVKRATFDCPILGKNFSITEFISFV